MTAGTKGAGESLETVTFPSLDLTPKSLLIAIKMQQVSITFTIFFFLEKIVPDGLVTKMDQTRQNVNHVPHRSITHLPFSFQLQQRKVNSAVKSN